MGARQSKRSVDITTTPKKSDGEVSPVGEEKIEKLADADVKAVVTNGTATHTDIEFADKDEEAKEDEEKATTDIKENGLPESNEGEKTPDKELSVPAAGDQSKTEESATEKTTENGEKVTETPDPKKQKEKKKKKWSLRSISFSKKDKSKPSKDKDKNGEVEELNEEKTEETVASPTAEPSKAEEVKATEEATPVTNGDASKEELVASVPETVKEDESEEVKKPEEPATAPVACDIIEKTPKPEPEASPKVEECIKPAIEETKKTEDIVAAPAAVEETKEVRKEEVPPPLPSSNPPSQVTVFAESTKENILSVEEVTVSDEPEPPVVEIPSSPTPVTAAVESLQDVTEKDPVEIDQIPTTEFVPNPPSTECEPDLIAEPSDPIIPVEKEPSKLDESVTSPETEQVENPERNESEVQESEPKPVIIETLPKKTDESLEQPISDILNVVKEDTSSNSIIQLEIEESNLTKIESNGSNKVESEVTSLLTDNEYSMPSIPSAVDEKMPMLSPGGDVVNSTDSQTCLLSIDLQELKSNLSNESGSVSEQRSENLSTINEVESQNLKLEDKVDSLSQIPIPSLNEIGSEQSSKDVIVEEETTEVLQQKDNNTDSLPDLSTESLPSLPEPTDSMLEPMSLPPLDSVPEPLVDDNLPSSPTKVDPPIPETIETEPPVVLTNGNATNGHKSSPTANDDVSPPLPPLDGPLKQIISPEPAIGAACENSQSTGDAAVESAEPATATE